MKQGLLSMLFVLGISYNLFAQDSEKTTLTNLFKEAASYPELKAKTAEIEAANLDHKITKRQNLPGLQFQAQNTYGTYEGIPGAFFPSSGIFNVSGDGNSSQTAVNTYISATANWEVIQFGKHRDEVKLADLEKAKAETNYELTDVELKRKITQVFLGWMYTKYMQTWASQEVERDQTILRLSQSRVNSGLASAADSLLAKANLKQTLAQKNQWEAKTKTAENRIKEFTHISFEDENPSDLFLSTLEGDLLQQGEENHPLLTTKDQERKQLEILEKNITSQVLPTISILAGGMFRGVGFNDQGNQWKDSYELPINNYLVGVGMTWNLSSFYDTGLKKKKNYQEQIRLKEEQEVIERYLDERKTSLENHISKSLEEIEEAEQAYAAAEESYQLFKVRYESGIIDLATLLQIQQTLQFTEKSRIKAYYDYWMYWSDYAYSQADFSVLTTVFN